MAGEILRKDEDYGEAVHAFSECQRQYPLSVGTSLNLAMALISIGRTTNARRVLEKISDLQGSNHLQVASTMARFDLDEGFCDLALERLENATLLLQLVGSASNAGFLKQIAQQRVETMLRCYPILPSTSNSSRDLASAALNMIHLAPTAPKSWELFCAATMLLDTGIHSPNTTVTPRRYCRFPWAKLVNFCATRIDSIQ